jgi:hypothetical protein
MRARVKPENPYTPLPLTSQPARRWPRAKAPSIERINEWCDDALEAVFCQYFPTLVVGFLVVIALFGAAMILLEVFRL